MLRQEMPGGRVAKSFPREERELGDLYARTEKGLEQIDQKVSEEDEETSAAKTPRQEAKRARTVALSQASQVASKQDLAALVNKAGSTMYMLEHQLPIADRKMFPKEAGELQAAFVSELSKLSKIRAQLQPKGSKAKKAPRMSLAAKAGAMPEHAQSSPQLDADKAKDDAENHKMASGEDLKSFFATVNGPTQSAAKTQRKAMHLSMLAKAQEEDAADQSVTDKSGDTETELPSAKKVAKVMGLNKHKTGKGKVKQPRRPSLTGPNTSIQKWGTVYDPTLSWGKMPMQQDLVGGGKKYFDHYAKEAAAYNNVFDPVTDNHSPDLNNWVKNDPQGKSKWWVHDHFGRGY
jgi:hypothetical protein